MKTAEAYRTLSEEVVAFVADNEPGTLAYQWHLSEDGTSGFHDLLPTHEPQGVGL